LEDLAGRQHDDAENDKCVRKTTTAAHILTELKKMTSRCIAMLDLQNCGLSGQDAERFQRCLNLSDNQIGAEGAGTLAGGLPQRPVLSHLRLNGNQIGTEGAE